MTVTQGIPLVHYVEERGEVVILWFVAVHAVIDCDKAYLLLGEQNLGIKADLNIMNEWYAKDTSNKISRARQKRRSNTALFCYPEVTNSGF